MYIHIKKKDLVNGLVFILFASLPVSRRDGRRFWQRSAVFALLAPVCGLSAGTGAAANPPVPLSLPSSLCHDICHAYCSTGIQVSYIFCILWYVYVNSGIFWS